ncbi:MAG: HNH endonuclease [Candidatus Promineifilaceae bacterium]
MGNCVLDEPVLVLNANYEPLNVCNGKRAINLLYASKADPLMNGRGSINSGSNSFKLPSVIRLRYMVKRPRPQVTLSKREILRRDNNKCQYCGRAHSGMTIDHIVPKHMGGEHSWLNLVAACPDCNRRKGGTILERTNMKLRRPPFRPKASAKYRFGGYLEHHQEWLQFINGW